MPIHKRSQARMLALQALCLYESLGDTFDEQLDGFLNDEHAHEDLQFETPLAGEYLEFAHDLARNTWLERAALDELLQSKIEDWTLARMPPVDRNILRIGLYELRACPDRSVRIVIHEAIELAHRFGDAESPAFINGVLDALYHSIENRSEENNTERADGTA